MKCCDWDVEDVGETHNGQALSWCHICGALMTNKWIQEPDKKVNKPQLTERSIFMRDYEWALIKTALRVAFCDLMIDGNTSASSAMEQVEQKLSALLKDKT